MSEAAALEPRVGRSSARFKQADAPLEILRGVSLTSGRARSSRWSARPAPASRRCCTSPACSSAPTAATCCSPASPATGMPDERAHRDAAQDLGFVYQFHHLLPEFTALENVMLPQMIAGVVARPGAGARARSC